MKKIRIFFLSITLGILTITLSSCGEIIKYPLAPIFSDGVYAGYEYFDYYLDIVKPGDPNYNLPEYCFLWEFEMKWAKLLLTITKLTLMFYTVTTVLILKVRK